MTRYTLSGKIEEVERIELILFKENEIMQQRPGSFSKMDRSGSQMFPNLEEGEYRLMARLINKDGNFFNTPFSEATVTFRVGGAGAVME